MPGTVVKIRVLASNMALAGGVSAAASAHGITERVSVGPGGVEGNGNCDLPSLSADGRFVAFDSDATNLVPGDINGAQDVFVRILAPQRGRLSIR